MTWMFEPTGTQQPMATTSPWMPDAEADTLWAFIERAPVALLAADDERHIVRVNSRWCVMTGYERERAVGVRMDELLAPESRPGIEMRWGDLLSTGLATARIVMLRADGARLPMRYGACATVLPGVHVTACIAEPGQDARMLRPARARRAGQLTR